MGGTATFVRRLSSRERSSVNTPRRPREGTVKVCRASAAEGDTVTHRDQWAGKRSMRQGCRVTRRRAEARVTTRTPTNHALLRPRPSIPATFTLHQGNDSRIYTALRGPAEGPLHPRGTLSLGPSRQGALRRLVPWGDAPRGAHRRRRGWVPGTRPTLPYHTQTIILTESAPRPDAHTVAAPTRVQLVSSPWRA